MGYSNNAPADDELLRTHSLAEFVHRTVIVHIDCNLFVCLAVENSKGISDINKCAVFAPCAQQSPDHTLLCICTSEIVIKNREEYNRVNRNQCGRASEMRIGKYMK